MLLSMTGYGKAVCELPEKKVTVEVKSLNSKQMDVSTRIPGYYREKELEIRNRISHHLGRGKVDFSIFVESLGTESNTVINQGIVENYFHQIRDLSQHLGIDTPLDWFQVLLRMPETMKTEIRELNEAEWNAVSSTIDKALHQLIAFREQEGRILEADITKRIHLIVELLDQVEPLEKERVEKVRTRIKDNLSELREEYDNNRFEQEMIFYLEKYDVTEEKVRLRNHCSYFLETVQGGSPIGKKLGFIAQEIGREINTLGSKANHAEMQKLVIQMKDELEKIKEQNLNIL